jgi:hypothetical protein
LSMHCTTATKPRNNSGKLFHATGPLTRKFRRTELGAGRGGCN